MVKIGAELQKLSQK